MLSASIGIREGQKINSYALSHPAITINHNFQLTIMDPDKADELAAVIIEMAAHRRAVIEKKVQEAVEHEDRISHAIHNSDNSG